MHMKKGGSQTAFLVCNQWKRDEISLKTPLLSASDEVAAGGAGALALGA